MGLRLLRLRRLRLGLLLGVELAHEGGGPLVDQGLELRLGDVGEGEVQDLVGLGGYGREVAVEEDCV